MDEAAALLEITERLREVATSLNEKAAHTMADQVALLSCKTYELWYQVARTVR